MKFNSKQQMRLDIISQYLAGQIFSEDACTALSITRRQFSRIVKAFRENGIISVIHGNKAVRPVNATSEKNVSLILSLYRNRYLGLNLMHFIEKLKDHHLHEIHPIPCYSTVRNLLIKEKVLKPQKVKRTKSHRMRKRYEKEGIMVQIDGSSHHWITGHRPFCLTAAVDDATGKIVGAKFTLTETTFAAMDVVEQIINKYGRFQMLYSDKAGIYGGGKRDGYSNMNRALRELDIVSVQANSPQAKGRIERLFKTLQSRLVSEIRLEGIKTIKEANDYLEHIFIDKFNNRFAKEATNSETAYRALPLNINLNEVFIKRVDRQIQSGHLINYDGVKYLVKSEEFNSLVKRRVEIRHYRDGDMKIFLLTGEELEFVLWENVPKAA